MTGKLNEVDLVMQFYDGYETDILIWGGIILLSLLLLVQNYNTFLTKRNRVKKTFAEMNTQLRKRFDLIPNFIEAIKACMTQESATFPKLIQLRSTAIRPNARIADKLVCNNAFNEFYRNVLAELKSYPQLRENEKFMRLLQTINQTEESVLSSTKAYNEAVTEYNKDIQSFPTCLIALHFHSRREILFELPSDERKTHKQQKQCRHAVFQTFKS